MVYYRPKRKYRNHRGGIDYKSMYTYKSPYTLGYLMKSPRIHLTEMDPKRITKRRGTLSTGEKNMEKVGEKKRNIIPCDFCGKECKQDHDMFPEKTLWKCWRRGN